MPTCAEFPGLRPLRRREFEQFRQLAHEKFGLDLKSGKEQLVASRLGKTTLELALGSFQDYYEHIMADTSGEALISMIDALTTNHTSFLREPAHFDFLRTVIIPGLESRDRIRIWCAASSTGQEPYSIAFCLLEQLIARGNREIEILASDVSRRVLQVAARAVYARECLDPLPQAWLSKYFLRGTRHSQGLYRVKPEVQKLLAFRRLNLIEPLPVMPPFPVILCRNVLIYFDKATQGRVVNALAHCLEPGGYLFIGHAESLTGIDQPLQYIQPAIYQKAGQPNRPVSRTKVRP
jgi:chemotaxis protein methyltransferase CheR